MSASLASATTKSSGVYSPAWIRCSLRSRARWASGAGGASGMDPPFHLRRPQVGEPQADRPPPSPGSAELEVPVVDPAEPHDGQVVEVALHDAPRPLAPL